MRQKEREGKGWGMNIIWKNAPDNDKKRKNGERRVEDFKGSPIVFWTVSNAGPVAVTARRAAVRRLL